MVIFDHPQNPHPLTDHQKIGTGDYVGGPYGHDKFGANRGLLGKWVKYNEFFLFIYTFFHELTNMSGLSTDFHA